MSPEQAIRPVLIEEEMRSSYLDYSMSVIISRALPDVRDGLKPVQRRILTAMNDLNLAAGRPYRKSAKITGDVNGNYHPHGTVAIYDAMVRMAQPFSMRYPLVDGQGNFGSVDGDPAAAERYTEARMTPLAGELLRDIDKETVDYGPNYDGSRQMPLVLPAVVPNLLMNGATGIAVGMATNIPPHNLGELVAGMLAMLDDPDIAVRDLMRYVPGPDFPTGGEILGREGIREAYETGRGKVVIRARAEIEPVGSERDRIVITEIPYMVNKAAMIERIADLVNRGHLSGVADIQDLSDKEGLRVVIELKKDAPSRIVLNRLFKHTQMQQTFGIILLGLVNNEPRVLTLKDLMAEFLRHREEVVVRKTRYDLRKAEERAHILEGYRIALDNLDAVIRLIRKAKDPQEAKAGLVSQFELTEVQAQAILDLRLHRLTGLERKKIEDEYFELLHTIERLKAVLANRSMVLDIIRKELELVREKYADERRTRLVDRGYDFEVEDLIAEEDMVITVSHLGYIKRLPKDTYRRQRRGGRGVTGASVREDDFVERLFFASTHSYILFFTDRGRCYWLKVHEIPQAGRTARGKAIANLINISREERVTSLVPVPDFGENRYLVMATAKGQVKKTHLSAYSNPRPSGIKAVTMRPEDRLIAADLTDGDQDIVLAKRNGKTIRFNEKDVRPVGRTAQGVRGVTLEGDDRVVGMVVLRDDPASSLLVVTENGFGKRSRLEDYRLQSRSGKGIITIRETEGRNGPVVSIRQVTDKDEVVMITRRGVVIRLPMSDVSVIGRNTKGVRLVNCDQGDQVVDVALYVREEPRNGEKNNGEKEPGEPGASEGGAPSEGPAIH
jgi:DNA gyrase subunit A